MLAAKIRESIETAVPFEVVKGRLFDAAGRETPHFGLFRSDNGQVVGGAVTERYEPHTREDVIAAAIAAADVFGDEARVTARWHRDGHRILIAPPKDYQRSVAGTDVIWPRLSITAGYSAESFRSSLGFFRTICTNLAAIHVANEKRTLRHVESLRDGIPVLVDGIARLAAGWDGAVEQFCSLDSKTVDLRDFVKQVFPLANEATDRVRSGWEDRFSRIRNRIYGERQQLRRTRINGDLGVRLATAWEAYNGVQGWVQHDRRRRGSEPAIIDRALDAYDDLDVQRAWALALAV